MTVLPWPAGQCPYVTPDQLYAVNGTVSSTAWPTGAQWGTIPFVGNGTASAAQQFSVLSMICLAASSEVDQILNQPIRAKETTEEQSGPNFRVTVQWSSGNGRFIASRWPVTQVTCVSVAPNDSWPRQFTALPAGHFEPEYPVDGLYGAGVPSSGAGGQGILFSPGYLCWGRGWPGGQVSGRNGFRVSVTYVSGWPHACLASAASAADTEIAVDDCTAWVLTGVNGGVVGAAGIIYDAMGGGMEPVAVTAASAPKGPGTLTLSQPLNFSHAAGIMVSALPQTAIWAAALLAGRIALTRGATATTIQSTGGRTVTASPDLLRKMAEKELSTFRRTV